MKLRLNKAVMAVSVGATTGWREFRWPVLHQRVLRPRPKPTYTIGVEGPLSGSNAELGDWIFGGVQSAVNPGERQWEVHFTLRLRSSTTRVHRSLSPAAAQKAVGTKGLVAVVGPAFSGASEAAAPYYKAAHVAEVSASATAVALASGSDSNFFRTIADDSVPGQGRRRLPRQGQGCEEPPRHLGRFVLWFRSRAGCCG